MTTRKIGEHDMAQSGRHRTEVAIETVSVTWIKTRTKHVSPIDPVISPREIVRSEHVGNSTETGNLNEYQKSNPEEEK